MIEFCKAIDPNDDYTHGHNIFRLLIFYQIFISPQVKRSVIISNTRVRDIRVASQVAEQSKTWDLGQLGNIRKLSKLYKIIA